MYFVMATQTFRRFPAASQTRWPGAARRRLATQGRRAMAGGSADGVARNLGAPEPDVIPSGGARSIGDSERQLFETALPERPW